MNKKISVIIPVYNEQNELENSVLKVASALEKTGMGYDIIIAEDGSTDKTFEIAKRLERDNIKVIHSEKRLGRGSSLSKAIRLCNSEIAMYMDVDLSTSLDYIPILISEIDAGAGIAVGSRLLPASKVERDLLRDVFSKGYNLFVRLLTGSKLHDHQCGFKAFSIKTVLPLLDEVEDNHWFWDTELLVRAQKKGIHVAEIPVEWKGTRKSKVNHFSDVLNMGKKVVKLSVTRIEK